MANGSNPNQPPRSNQPNPDVVSSTREAQQSYGDMRNKVKKLRNLADTGNGDQSGFLSPKQVTLYRRLMREIEQIYQQHYQKLSQMEQQYQQDMQRKYGKNLDGLRQEVKRRQQNYNNANGGNRWGDTASPQVRAYHEKKLNESTNNLKEAENKDRELDGLREAIRRLEQQRGGADPQSDRIDNLQVRNPNTSHYIRRATTNVLFGLNMLHGEHALIDYANPDLIRRQERLASGVSQKLPEYDGIRSADANFRDRMRDVGLENNYGTLETGATANILATGGLKTGRGELSDLNQAQRFSRAYGTDVNDMASGFSSLRKMGAMGEGDMNRFADLIGGAVAKNGMRGREAEMLQSTMQLIQNVSQGLPQMTDKSVGNVVAMQTALGKAVPSLKGERGAEVLSNWNSAIKGGDTGFDLIMGRGTNPQYTGLQGSYKLGLMKEQGLTPENSKEFFQGLDKMFGNGPNSDAMKAMAYKQEGFGTMTEYNALQKSGFLDMIKKGKMPTASQLRKVGATDLAKQFANYNNSETSRVDWQNAQKENQKADYQKPFDQIGKAINGAWFQIPEAVRMPLLTAGFLGGGHLAYRGMSSLASRVLSPTVRNFVGGGGGSGIWAGLRSGASKIGGKALSLLADTSKSVPLIGAAVETVADRVQNPQHSWGRSLAKGIGTGIGTGLGMLASGLVDVGTGGLGIVTNAGLTMGGAYLGSKAGDWIYNLFNGNSDTKTSKQTASAPINNTTAKDKEYALASSVDALNKNNEVKITVSGKIDGLSPDNQKKVADSISNYFNGSVNNYNLVFDQRRG
jgi:hypothetical protein